MKKLSLLVGTLGGALAGYVFSNNKLRKELSDAKDGEQLAKILGKHLQKDGKKVAKHVQTFVNSDDVQKNVTKAKKYVKDTYDSTQKQVKEMMDDTADTAKKKVKKTATKAKKAVNKKAKSVKKSAAKTAKNVRKNVKTAAKKAKKAVRS